MCPNHPKAFKNFIIQILCRFDINESNKFRIMSYITNKIYEIEGRGKHPINIGSLLILIKDNILIVFCIVNDRSLTKRERSIPDIITLSPDYEILNVTVTNLDNFISVFKNCIKDDFKILAVPK
jgi:hypothetical protein